LLNGKPVKELSTRAAEALVIYILHQPRPVQREQLADMFFQASEPKQAAANLRAMLSQIKKQLNPFIEITRYAVGRREGAGFSADSLHFNQQLRDERLTVDELRSALDQYQGDFLAGFYLRDAPEFEQWVLIERERLRLLAIDGLQRLIQAQERRGDFRGTLLSADKLLAIEPLLESVHRSKMLMLTRLGQRARALRHFTIAEQIFADELSVDLSTATTSLRDRIQALPDQTPHNLPALRGEFIGRQAEIERLIALLAQPSQRLLTLVGMGGVGKTRLSQEIAGQLHAAGFFLDGVYFIELAGIAATDALPIQLASRLNVPLRGQRDPAEQLIAAMCERELLLVLDNFEQLVGAQSAEFLARVLRDVPDVKLLVTSRERLNLYEETVYNVGGLPVPTDVTTATQVESVTLFMRHAQRQRVVLGFDSADIAAIVSICQRVDGVPLALELAASLVNHYQPQAIAQHIQASFDLLTTRYHNMPDRQRSVRAVFDYSWDLLTSAERKTLTTLALFVGNFRQDAALAIADATVAQLTALVDQSLLQQQGDVYSLHPLVMQYSAEKLSDPDTQMYRFATYYADLIAGLDLIEHWPTFNARIPSIRFAIENVQKSWHWLLANATRGDAAVLMIPIIDKMRRPLRSYFLATSEIYAGHLLFKQAHAQLRDAGWATGTPTLQMMLAKIAIHDVDLGRIIGDYPRAVEIAEPLIPLLEATEAFADLHSAYLMLREAYRYVGRSADAAAVAPNLERVVFQSERDELVGSLYLEYAHAAREAGNRQRALERYRQAVSLLEPLENPRYLAIAYDYMGAIYYAQDELALALEHQERALRYAQSGALAYTEAVILLNLPLSYAALGDYEKAFATLLRGRQMFQQMNQQSMLVVADRTRGDLLKQQGRWEDAATAYRAALSRAKQLGTQRVTARVLARLPELLCQQNDYAAAQTIMHHLADEETLGSLETRHLAAARLLLAQFSAETPPILPLDHVIDRFLKN
jgi:predicted ATPase/DNA-binding SARP family transcriptional activator